MMLMLSSDPMLPVGTDISPRSHSRPSFREILYHGGLAMLKTPDNTF